MKDLVRGSDAWRGNGQCCVLLQGRRVHKRWAIAAVKEVHHARCLLQPSALEIFLHDRSNALLNFASNKVCPTPPLPSPSDTLSV